LEIERVQEFGNSRPNEDARPQGDEVAEGRNDDVGTHQSGENRHRGSGESREKVVPEDNMPGSVGVAGSNSSGGDGYFDDDDINFDVHVLEDVDI
ncbi:unnamed protein product, partial [Ectocarpus sp. 12 AP-2014]